MRLVALVAATDGSTPAFTGCARQYATCFLELGRALLVEGKIDEAHALRYAR